LKKPLDSNRHGGIDLHIHSTASDGIHTPLDIVQMAVDLGLEAIAITDHDTLEGIRHVQNSALPDCLHFVSGLEISAAPPAGFPMKGSLHILGYGVDPTDQPLQSALNELQEARRRRNPQIIARLNEIGIPIAMQEVEQLVGQGSAGRPHIARVLIEKGVVADINTAFDLYLAKGRPAYVDKYRIPAHRALALIHAAGGVSVLAHPYLVPESEHPLEDLIDMLHAMGLTGIEAYYPHHNRHDVERYLGLARRYGLIVTGGTDFHGNQTPEIHLGRGLGDLFVPFDLYKTLVTLISKP